MGAREVDLKPNTREWLEHRENYANASEAPAVMGVSPYEPKNKTKLTQYRRGDKEKFVHAGMKEGHKNEPLIRQSMVDFLTAGGRDIVPPEIRPAVFVNDEYDIPLSASLDGFYENDDGLRIGLEIKNVKDKASPYWSATDEVSKCLMPQIVHQFITAELDLCYVAVESRLDGEIQVWSVTREQIEDAGLADALLDEWAKVWPYIVCGQIYPDERATKDEKFLTLARQYLEADEEYQAAKDHRDAIKDQLIEQAGGDEAKAEGLLMVSWVKGRETPDYSKLPEDVVADLPKKSGKGYWKITKEKPNNAE